MEQLEKIMELVIRPTGSTPIHNCMLFIKDERNGLNFSKAIGLDGPDGKAVKADQRFRIGSITKLFTAALVLQLAEEGLLKTEDLYFDLINEDSKKLLSGLHLYNGVDYSSTISLHHLLNHSSGLRDYFSEDKRFLDFVMEYPSQSWNWKKVMAKYFEFKLHKKPTFIPGQAYHYADTNYLLLAVLLEQLTGKSLNQLYKENIFLPLGLTNTYLEFYELPDEEKLVVYPFYGIHSLEKVNTSFDWGGGGLISTMDELDIFIRSLMKGLLFKKLATLDLMLQLQNQKTTPESTTQSSHYGLGIQKKDFPVFSFFGHSSAYGSLLYYEAEKEISVIISLNQLTAMHKVEWMMKKIISEFKIGRFTEE
jgi:D-alanyl-D-alanine carboxypeptidase